MFRRILLVCTGNVCRSPVAAILWRRHAAAGVDVRSAGLAALVGEPIDPRALRVLRRHGLHDDGHRARQLARAMLHEADLVLAMEQAHLLGVTRMAPEATGRACLLGRWLASREIPDPYRGEMDDFERVHRSIAECVESWQSHLG
ncbi:low molecular weight protein-tyrosine-phosphatase [Xanthomonas massiliensis]|uniref:low molecular weight protein-tyrosine-phosphatase n=1 Tax=Xanthomonas massiliensis TaxID=1720302 RepID=UPI0008257162|nr:low molecular weight protein-tyrosine-phosphatase [Xanthomonas massiliensis]